MNIIELFEELKIDKNNILLFSPEDIIKVEKQINVEKKINLEINAQTSENLIIALKDYKEELLFVLSNRVLFNFFTHNNLDKNHFSDCNLTISEEKMKQFISLFLADDLVFFFSLNLSKSTFKRLKKLDALLGLKKYFPEEVIYKISPLVYSKLDFAVSQLAVLNTNEFSNIIYIKHKTFYKLLSHFATIELDKKMGNLLPLVVKHYKNNTDIYFFTSVIKAMSFYNAYNENMSKTLAKNRDILSELDADIENEKTHRGISVIIAAVFILMLFLTGKCSLNYFV
ncbi:hypothetical protein [Flavobacterium quisquiliarum]|uniref:Uncharacterized protein n=1 Tax=Flavobacterium quisquiliarum TaxID=1834436 RepID=A0ABV8W8E5_9FLAO|nr:hypothetical protein [Flavobacterium quisquiliarum]MBW1656899.1 hypothetical protein [Flavobacterium quisquiliarum]